MGLLNSIGAGLSAAGYAAGDMFARQAAQEQASSLDLERAKRMAEFQDQLKSAPMRRFGAMAKEEAGKDVTEPGKTTEVPMDVPSEFIGGENTGIENAKGLLNQPATTRKRTTDEALQAASDRAKLEDPEAYAEYESRIGKPLREERKLDAMEAKNEADAKARGESDARKEKIAAQKDATDRYIADLRSRDANKRLDALIAAQGKGKDGTKEAMSFIDSQRKELAAESTQLRQLYKTELGNGPSKKHMEAMAAKYEPQIAAIEAKRSALESDFDILRKQVGLPAREPKPAPAPAPKPGAVSGLPQGARQIGTSGGKPVYETPDGKRFIQK